MTNVYHLEKILIFPTHKPFFRDVTIRFGNNSGALSLDNEVVFTYPGEIPLGFIFDIPVTSMNSGRYLSIISDSGKAYFAFGSIQVITKDNF